MANNDISAGALKVLKWGAELGRTLQFDMPEIAQDYRAKISKPKIIERRKIESIYGIRRNVALKAVSCLLRGHNGRGGVCAYEGLIPDKEELNGLGKKIQGKSFDSLTKADRIANGKKVYEDGLGIHAYTKEERKKQSKKGGLIAKRDKLGFHAFTPEQRKASQLKASVASGNVLWTNMQKQRVHELAKDDNYRWASKGPNYDKIAQQINIEFHDGEPIRKRTSINYILFRTKPIVASA